MRGSAGIATGLVIGLVIALSWMPGAMADAGGEMSPSDRAHAYQQVGYALHQAGEYADAAALYRRSIEIHPTAEAHTYLGWSLSLLGKLDDAIAECKKAIAVDPEFANPYNDIGTYLIELNRADEALPWFEKAITAERYCCYQYAHFNRGRVLLTQGRIDEARRAFERALEHDPAYAPARIGLEYLRQMGSCLSMKVIQR